MELSNPRNRLRYLAFSLSENGKPQVTLETTELHYTPELPAGYAEVETLQAGACPSELIYYARTSDNTLSRFEQDSTNKEKFDYFLERNMRAGVIPEPDNIARLSDLMRHSMFHEGLCRIRRVHPKLDEKKVPVQRYIPRKNAAGSFEFVKNVIETNFQEDIGSGMLTVRSPSYLCDEHSRADNINPATGWPYQCHRGDQEGHTPKGAIGHTEYIGAAIQGNIRVPLDMLIPLPFDLQQFVEKELKNRACVLTAIEPLGCVFDAFGTMLHSGERPSSIVVIGDGWTALNIVAFLQVFAPLAKIIIIGKHKEKLETLKRMRPDTITTLLSEASDYSDLERALGEVDARGQSDVVMVTVPLEEQSVTRFVRDSGTMIWWAARISAFAQERATNKRYRERFPYGGCSSGRIICCGIDGLFRRGDARGN